MYTVIVKRELDMDNIFSNNIRLTIYNNKSITDATWKRPIIFELNENKQWLSSGYYGELIVSNKNEDNQWVTEFESFDSDLTNYLIKYGYTTIIPSNKMALSTNFYCHLQLTPKALLQVL